MHEGGDDAERVAPPGPGHRLREARQSQGLAAADVARELRLDVRIVEALEADDFASLPAPIFTRGYVNAYCRLLGLPGDECIADYERAAGGTTPPPLVVRRSAGESIGSGGPPVMVVGWLVVAVALVMVALWWFARGDDEPAPTEPQRATIPIVAPTVTPPAATGDDVADEAAIEEPPEGSAVDEPAVEPPAEPGMRARFVFHADSWAEIVDANGRRLHFDLARGGTTLEVSGEPPFSVFLGNAPGVRITVDGRPFDHSRYVRSGNVARFSIGDVSASARP